MARDVAHRHFRKHGQVCAANALNRLNKEICKANLQKHVTVFFDVIDPDENKLNYASAGHYPMPIVGDGKDYDLFETRTISNRCK